MSIDVNRINIGTQPNDGTGLTIRDAFAIVNSNFANIDQRINTGNIATINASGSIIGRIIVANTSIKAQTLQVTSTAGIEGNLTTKDVKSVGNIEVTGNISATSFVGNSYGILYGNAATTTKLAKAITINGVWFDGTANVIVSSTSANALSGPTLAANVVNSSLTSVGTLQDLQVTNAIAGSVLGSASTVTNPAQSSITSVGTLTKLDVSGNLTIQGSFVGNVAGIASSATKLVTPRMINGVNFDGTTSITVTANAATLSGTTLAANIATSSLTTVGTLTSLVVNNNISSNSLAVTSNISLGSVTVLGNTYVNFHSSGIANDYDSRIAATGGSLVAGKGALQFYAAGGVSVSADLIVGGNLTINGTTTTINSTTVSTVDKNIVIAANATTSAIADGSGITVAGANATILYHAVTDTWAFNKTIVGNVAGAIYTESVTAPKSPTIGDEWYDSLSSTLFKFMGTAWAVVNTIKGTVAIVDGGTF